MSYYSAMGTTQFTGGAVSTSVTADPKAKLAKAIYAKRDDVALLQKRYDIYKKQRDSLVRGIVGSPELFAAQKRFDDNARALRAAKDTLRKLENDYEATYLSKLPAGSAPRTGSGFGTATGMPGSAPPVLQPVVSTTTGTSLIAPPPVQYQEAENISVRSKDGDAVVSAPTPSKMPMYLGIAAAAGALWYFSKKHK